MAITSQQRFHLSVSKNCGSGNNLLPDQSPRAEVTCHTPTATVTEASVKKNGESAIRLVHAICTGPAEYIIMMSWTSVQDAHVRSTVCQAV